jgi:hypothetical protein
MRVKKGFHKRSSLARACHTVFTLPTPHSDLDRGAELNRQRTRDHYNKREQRARERESKEGWGWGLPGVGKAEDVEDELGWQHREAAPRLFVGHLRTSLLVAHYVFKLSLVLWRLVCGRAVPCCALWSHKAVAQSCQCTAQCPFRCVATSAFPILFLVDFIVFSSN